MKIIAYLPTPGGLTGAPRRLLTLSTVLRSRNLSVCIAADENSELLKEANRLGFDILPFEPVGVLRLRGGTLFENGVFFKLKVILALIYQNIKYFRLLKKYKADVVWIRGSKGVVFSGFGALLSCRPLIWDVDYELPSRGVVRWIHRFALWSAHSVVFQYQSAPDDIFGKSLADKYRHKFISIIPGIDLSAIELYRKKRHRRSVDSHTPFLILQVGTVCDRKNQMLLLDALSYLDFDNIQRKVCVKFLGGLKDENYVEEVRRSIVEKGLDRYVEVLGWRDDVHEWMVQADLLVMPSKDEGVPNTVQEAMYIGIPVVVSDVGGMPEIVNDGTTGWILPLHEPEKWACNLMRLIENSDMCSRVGRNASFYADENFGTEKWGNQYVKLIFNALKL